MKYIFSGLYLIVSPIFFSGLGFVFGQDFKVADNDLYYTPALSIKIEEKTFPEDKRLLWQTSGWNKPDKCGEPKYNPDSVKWSADKNGDYTDSVYFSLSEKLPENSSLTVTYEIKADKDVIGYVGNQSVANNNREARGYFSGYKGELLFTSSVSRRGIPIRIIDRGDGRGDASFTITLSGYRTVPNDGGIKPILSGAVTFWILTDDPNGEFEVAPPIFVQNRVIEFYDWARQGSQEVATLNLSKGDSCYYYASGFEIVEIFDGAQNGIDSDWFEIADGKIRTTKNYRADYENSDEQKINFKVKTVVRKDSVIIESVDTTVAVRISPWNDNKFEPKEDSELFNEKDRVLIIDVLRNDNADADLPSVNSERLLYGLTKRELIGEVTLNTGGLLTDVHRAREITSDITGAKITIENGKVKYDVSHINIGSLPATEDVFYYTALDTARYRDHENNSYDTDTWVKSVKVSVSIIDIVLPPKSLGDSFFYDTDGNGRVDRIVVPFDKEIKDLSSIKFDVKFAGVDDYVINTEYGIDEDGNSDRSVVVINLGGNDALQDSTGGIMEVTVTYLNDEYRILTGGGELYSYTVYPKDRAAPVVVKRAKVTASIFDGVNDILTVYLSEGFDIDVSNGNLAFKFMKTPERTLYDVRFDKVAVAGNECVLVVNSDDNSKISKGDSIFINYDANVRIKDINGNEQTARDNKKVEIDKDILAEIVSAAYFDTDMSKDGYVDLIKIDVGVNIDSDIAQTLADAIEPNLPRGFSVFRPAALNLNKTGFDLKVEEQAKREADKGNRKDNLPNTGVDENDVIKLLEDIRFGDITIKANKKEIDDSVAPVILYAEYDVEKSILDAVFSEAVKPTSKGNPYLFWDESPAPGRQFTMTFTNSSPDDEQPNGNTLRYYVESTGIAYPVDKDSIWLVNRGYVSDISDNVQDLTVRAPIVLKGSYPNNLELHIVPNPLALVNTGGKGHEPYELDEGLLTYFSIPRGRIKGAAIVLEARGPVSDNKSLRGFFKIFDNTGNAVTDGIDMEFSDVAEGSAAGAGVWDGKNRNGRNVGAGTYLVLVQAEIKFHGDEYPQVYTLKKIIAVSVGKRRQ